MNNFIDIKENLFININHIVRTGDQYNSDLKKYVFYIHMSDGMRIPLEGKEITEFKNAIEGETNDN